MSQLFDQPCTRRNALALALMGAVAPHALAQAPAGTAVKGTGATSVSRIYAAWIEGFSAAQRGGVKVQYAGMGSGEGVRAITAREVAFGASDERLSAQELATRKLVQVPAVVLGIAPVVNLPGVATGALRLDSVVLAGIFLGQIKQGNDPAVAALNPQIKLPALPIRRVVSAQASGTTASFTHFLALSSPEWKALAGLSPKWPGEVMAAPGSDAVVEKLRTVPGAIGFVGYDRVHRAGLSTVSLKNAAGRFVSISPISQQAAVNSSGVRDNLNASLLNAPGPDSWPLTTLTYLLLDATPTAASAAATSVAAQLIHWGLINGDPIVRSNGYVPLPPNVQAVAFASLASLRGPGGEVLVMPR